MRTSTKTQNFTDFKAAAGVSDDERRIIRARGCLKDARRWF